MGERIDMGEPDYAYLAGDMLDDGALRQVADDLLDDLDIAWMLSQSELAGAVEALAALLKSADVLVYVREGY